MKKWLIAAILIFLVVLIVVAVVLCVKFMSIYNGVKPTEPPQQTLQTQSVLAYAQEKWPKYTCGYDAASNTLTLTAPTTLTYEQACSFGSNVYCDENAPETYLDEVSMIALTAASDCSLPSVTVLLCYASSDGQTIFSVKSDGTIRTCWD